MPSLITNNAGTAIKPLFPRGAMDVMLDPERYKNAHKFYEHLRKAPPGMIVGEFLNPYRDGEPVTLVDYSDRFIGMFAPTRTGKGVSFIIPNALTWTHSLFCNDPKGEISNITAWWRRHMLGQLIFIVNPSDTTGRAARFNPMDEVRVKTIHEVQDAMNFATAVVDPDGSGFEGKEGVWKKRARDILAGIALHILWAPEFKEKSLRTCIQFATDPTTPFIEKLKQMVNYEHDKEGVYGWRRVDGSRTLTHPFISSTMKQQIDRPEAEAGSVKSEYESYLSIYRSELTAWATAESDFSMADIMDSPVPASIFLNIEVQDMETVKPLTRLFLNLMINRNMRTIEFDPYTGRQKPVHRWKLGMLLDEFTSTLGRLDVFSKQLAFIAGYGFKPAVVVQDMQQLLETYGQLENITSNIHTIIAGMMNNTSSAEYFSKKLGQRTIGMESVGTNMQGGQMNYGRNEQTLGIPLLSPRQIEEMDEEFAMIFQAGLKPVPIRKLRYYEEDTAFKQRVVPFPMEEESDRIPRKFQLTQLNRAEEQAAYLDHCRKRLNSEQAYEQMAKTVDKDIDDRIKEISRFVLPDVA